jgi:hypothetical protein
MLRLSMRTTDNSVPRSWLRCLVFCVAGLAACDVSDPERFPPDASSDCSPIFGPEETIFVDHSCEQPTCVVTVHQDRCELHIQVSGCTEETIKGHIDREGILTFDDSSSAGICRPVPLANGARIGMACDRTAEQACRLDFYPSVDRNAEFRLTTLSIDTHDFQEPMTRPDKFMAQYTPYMGWLGPAALVEDRLVIVKYGAFESPLCIETTSSTFEMVDLSTFAVVASAPAPSCTMDVIADPLGDGFIAAYGGLEPAIAIFDRAGTLIRSTTVAANGMQFLLELDHNAGMLYALISSDASSSYVVSYSLPDLRYLGTSNPIRHRARALSFVRPSGLVLSDPELSGMLLMGADLTEASSITLLSTRGSSNDPGAILVAPDLSGVFVSATGRDAAVWVLNPMRPDPIVGDGVPYERQMVPWAMARAKKPDHLWVGSVARDESRDALLGTFDTAESHFLPGLVRIGRGVVREMINGENHVVYAVLPWEGTLVRIEPTR